MILDDRMEQIERKMNTWEMQVEEGGNRRSKGRHVGGKIGRRG